MSTNATAVSQNSVEGEMVSPGFWRCQMMTMSMVGTQRRVPLASKRVIRNTPEESRWVTGPKRVPRNS